MGKEKRGPLALEYWAKQLIDSYPGVTVQNMTSSWRSGLAFCALIHRFRPDLIDYDKLDPSDIIGNCSLAFEIAESKLGIPSLLDPLDMEAMDIPDRLSVLTYVAQFYNAFKNLEVKSRVSPRQDEVDENDADVLKNRSADKSASPSPDKMVTKRKNASGVDEDEIMDKVKRSMPNRSVMLSTANVCSECKNPVFISERVLFMKKLYHRSCFRCSNCKNPLNPHIVDVSSDGSLFCLEKTCHLELLNRMNDNSADKDISVPNVDNILSKDSKSQVKQSDVQYSYSNAKTPQSDANANKENIEIDDNPEPNLHAIGSRLCEMESKFHIVQGDGQSQGDTQKLLQKQYESPSSTRIPKNDKLMDFAGALLHVEDKPDIPAPSPVSSYESYEGTVGEPEGKDLDRVENRQDTTEIDNTTQKENPISSSEQSLQETEEQDSDVGTPNVVSSCIIEVRNTPEDTSIRGKAILNVADQFKVFSYSSQESPQGQIVEESESAEIVSNTSSENPEQSSSTESVELHEPDSEEITTNDSALGNEESVCKKETDESADNPFDDEEDDDEKVATLKPGTTLTEPSMPSPIAKRRVPPVVPPPPKISFSPSPVPRSRTKGKTVDSDPKSTEEVWKRKDYYPADLNPFDSEEEVEIKETIPSAPPKINVEPKNPFDDEEDDPQQIPPSPKPRPRTSTPISKNAEINNNGILNKSRSPAIPHKNAANFNVPPPRPPPPQPSPRKLPLPKPYNPFEDDNDDDIGEYDDEKPSGSFHKRPDDSSSISSKTSDLSGISGVPTPTPRSLNASDAEGSGSMKVRSRKSRRAPLPPNMSSSDLNMKSSVSTPPPVEKKVIPVSPKLMKGMRLPTPGHQQPRKKRRAPPPRRRVEPLPEEAIKTEFADLEIKLKELERQGINLESTIRSLTVEEKPGDGDDPESGTGDDGHSDQADEMMIQLWAIVNEKNDILRRQTELEYLRRGHRLEEMQSELEFKLRILMDTPEDQKQPNHADMEQVLLHQLLKLVDERNEVVDWLDYHRQQEREEEKMLDKSISQFTTGKTVEPIPDVPSSSKWKFKSEKKEKSKDESHKDKKGKMKLGIFKKRSKKSKAVDSNTEP